MWAHESCGLELLDFLEYYGMNTHTHTHTHSPTQYIMYISIDKSGVSSFIFLMQVCDKSVIIIFNIFKFLSDKSVLASSIFLIRFSDKSVISSVYF
jgi:hypothetical protein